MSGRAFFSIFILFFTVLFFRLSANPIAFFLSIVIIIILLIGFVLALIGRIYIQKGLKGWRIAPPVGVINFADNIYGSLKLNKHPPLLFSILPSFYADNMKFGSFGKVVKRHSVRSDGSVTVQLENLSPGFYIFNRCKLESVDFLGLFHFSKRIQADVFNPDLEGVLVLPFMGKEKENWAFEKSKEVKVTSHNIPVKKEMSYFDSKPYEATDDAKRIIWKRFARSNVLTVHTYEQRQQNDMLQPVVIDPVLPLGQIRYRLPFLKGFYRSWHWSRVKEMAAFQIYHLFHRDIPVSWTLDNHHVQKVGRQRIVETGNENYLFKNLQEIFSLPLFESKINHDNTGSVKDPLNGKSLTDSREDLLKKDKNSLYISGRKISYATVYVPIWHELAKDLFLKEDKNKVYNLFSILASIFFEYRGSVKMGPSSFLRKSILMIFKWKDLYKKFIY